MRLYTDSKEAVRSAIQRSSQKLAALDLRRPGPKVSTNPVRRHWERLRKHLERRRRIAYYDSLRPSWGTSPHNPDRQPPGARKNPPTHAERERARQQQKDYGHER
jgi:hypothetical protein